MNSPAENFEFNYNEIPLLNIEAVLRVIDNLPDTVEFDQTEELSAENRLAINSMSEVELAQYLQEFVGKYNVGAIRADDLLGHTMFQAVLARAREIETA